ncbi:MAG: hypothetical protein U1D55_14935 [Phycisphaerae bacterium]
MKAAGKFIAAGAKVRVVNSGPVPKESYWDDDKQRTSTSVKRRLQSLFFQGDKRIRAEVVYIVSDSERNKLRSMEMVKLSVRDAAGSLIVITAPTANLQAS